MTEDEAKTKWCPAVRITGESERWHPMTNREVLVDPNSPPFAASRCIGSACMAWRWVDKAGTDEAGQPNYYAGRWQGFCGLAGKP